MYCFSATAVNHQTTSVLQRAPYIISTHLSKRFDQQISSKILSFLSIVVSYLLDMISLRKLEQIISSKDTGIATCFVVKYKRVLVVILIWYCKWDLQLGILISERQLPWSSFLNCSQCFDFPLLQNHKVNTHNQIKWSSDSEYYLITPLSRLRIHNDILRN